MALLAVGGSIAVIVTSNKSSTASPATVTGTGVTRSGTAAATVTTHATSVTTASTRTSTTPTYTVAAGDTLSTISAHTGVSVASLESANPGVNSNSLTIGQVLKLK